MTDICRHNRCGGALVPWDCGCAWGCGSCNFYARCDTCGKYHEHRKKRHPKHKCPYCGALKVGILRHVYDAHPDKHDDYIERFGR